MDLRVGHFQIHIPPVGPFDVGLFKGHVIRPNDFFAFLLRVFDRHGGQRVTHFDLRVACVELGGAPMPMLIFMMDRERFDLKTHHPEPEIPIFKDNHTHARAVGMRSLAHAGTVQKIRTTS
jgi:hypothetical protein